MGRLWEWWSEVKAWARKDPPTVIAALFIGAVVLETLLLSGKVMDALTAFDAIKDDDKKVEAFGKLVSAIGLIAAAPVAVAGVALAFWRTWNQHRDGHTALQNVKIAEQKLDAEAYAKAVEQLGSDKSSIRMGAVLALDALGKSTPRLLSQVIELLCAYIRETRSIAPQTTEDASTKSGVSLSLPTDVLLILAIILRLKEEDKVSIITIDFSNVNFFNTDLSKTNLSGFSLSGANLSGANLSGANLSGANLSEVNLSGANLCEANLSGANLNGANLSDANLSKVNLSGANLSEANLSGANLSVANLNTTNLYKANLTQARLSGSDLSMANLRKANLSEIKMNKANLRMANLGNASISGANLFGSNLSFADLGITDLSMTDLSMTDLTGANLTQARLTKAKLFGATLKSTTLPDGTTWTGKGPPPGYGTAPDTPPQTP